MVTHIFVVRSTSSAFSEQNNEPVKKLCLVTSELRFLSLILKYENNGVTAWDVVPPMCSLPIAVSLLELATFLSYDADIL
jgi:hypothetical protein